MHDIKLILTGTADGLDDYEFRFNSISCSVKNGTQSRLTVNLPYITEYIDEYYYRPGGDLNLYIDNELFLTFNPSEPLSFNRGANSGSIRIQGTKQVTYTQENTIDVSKRVISESGNKIFSIAGFIDIKPGDIIKFSGRKIKILDYSFTISISGFLFKLNQDEDLIASCYPLLTLYPSLELYPCSGA